MKTLKYTLGSLLLVMAMSACTNLHEKVIDEVLGSNNASPENALAAAYGQMDDGTFVDHSQVFAMQEYTTDEALLPTRGSDWGDGGVWRTMHEFTWAPDNSIVTTTWNSLNAGITKSLTAISTVNNAKDFSQRTLFMAEARGMLAFIVLVQRYPPPSWRFGLTGQAACVLLRQPQCPSPRPARCIPAWRSGA